MSNWNASIPLTKECGFEAIHAANLFHATSYGACLMILQQNRIAANTEQIINNKWVKGVSCTRDFRIAISMSSACVLELNREQLSHNYRIAPVDEYGENPTYGDKSPYETEQFATHYRRSEAEEFIVGSVEPLDRYLIAIHGMSAPKQNDPILGNPLYQQLKPRRLEQRPL